MFSRRRSVEPIEMIEESASPRRRRTSAGEVFAPILTFIGSKRVSVPPTPSTLQPTLSPREPTLNDDVAPIKRRRRRLPRDSLPTDACLPAEPLQSSPESKTSLHLTSDSSCSTFIAQTNSETEIETERRAASLPNDKPARTCQICEAASCASISNNALSPSPCNCSFAWVHIDCLEAFRRASGRNTCPVCSVTWYQGYAQVKQRRSCSLSGFSAVLQ
ncbi:hypothetical protein LEN26_006806 [Aphanomyces euteiches]|nr:hypothetical protein AeMF1_020725 [Aphanomyces euteiches]KAH9134451.1 hypothetical protein LEN26_006806 [Aphanomyces euteiches]KAH9193190.1 hypothetical protein AeNC1_004828 [Aphanomyces euteiches]